MCERSPGAVIRVNWLESLLLTGITHDTWEPEELASATGPWEVEILEAASGWPGP